MTMSSWKDLKKLVGDFKVENLGASKYFHVMEFVNSKEVIFVTQQKYVFELLYQTGLLGCKSIETPIEANLKL